MLTPPTVKSCEKLIQTDFLQLFLNFNTKMNIKPFSQLTPASKKVTHQIWLKKPNCFAATNFLLLGRHFKYCSFRSKHHPFFSYVFGSKKALS